MEAGFDSPVTFLSLFSLSFSLSFFSLFLFLAFILNINSE